MKLFRAALSGIFLWAILANAPGYARTPGNGAPFSLPASFAGTSMCADCAGIRLTLTMRPDGTFVLRHVYAGKPPATTWYERGTWRYERAKAALVLHGRSTHPEIYRVLDPRTLQPLDAQGEPLPAHVQKNLRRIDAR
jgi:copper homeostasis protein (lipoprotein)